MNAFGGANQDSYRQQQIQQQIQQMQQQLQQMQQLQQLQQMQQPQTQQTATMTPPTRYASIILVDSEQAAELFPVGTGQTQMMMAMDDSFIAIKSVLANNEPTLDVYVRRPPAPPKPAFDPAAYVTKEELETRLRTILTPQTAEMKEEKHNEPV